MALTLEVSQKDRGESPAPAAVSARTRSRSTRTRSSSAASASSLRSHGVSPDGTIALVRDLKACIESTIDRYVRDQELLDARIWTDGVLRSLEELVDSTCDYVVLHAPEPGSELEVGDEHLTLRRCELDRSPGRGDEVRVVGQLGHRSDPGVPGAPGSELGQQVRGR